MNVDCQRTNASNENIIFQRKGSILDPEGIGDVLLHQVHLSLFFGAIHDCLIVLQILNVERFLPLLSWLEDELTRLTSRYLAVKIGLDPSRVLRKDPTLRKYLIMIAEKLLHLFKLRYKLQLVGDHVHAGEMIYLLEGREVQ